MAQAPRILAGRYEVGELIGHGGMAEVHIGHDTRLGRTVAIKILRTDLARDPSFQTRFRREAQSAASLNHPSIVAVYDTGEETYTEASGSVAHLPFIVMEYVEGHTVRDILRDGHAVPIDEAVEIVSGVLSALEYSHIAGIVHRDIKPANVMITPTGVVKVMDFGIARAMADSAATMTQTQAVIGTAQYLSPEQAKGETVDTRSDLYSTGCLLFELLTGRPPFTGDSPVAVAYQHVREAPVLPSSLAGDVPEALDRITLRSLAKERDARYQTAAEFRSDLESAIHGGAITAPTLAVVSAAAVGAPENDFDPNATQVFGSQTQPVPTSQWGPTGVGPTDPIAGPVEEEKKPRRALMWTLIAIAAIAVAALVFLLITKGNQDKAPELVQVPSLAGMNADQAEEALTKVDLKMKSFSEPDTTEKGLFTRSEPGVGEDVEVDTVVDVWFSTGPESTKVPDLEGKTQDEARSLLEKAGLEAAPVTKSETGGSIPRDSVTRTDPKAGETLPTGSTVTLYVSDGQVEIPDLTGMTKDEATQTLKDLNAGITWGLIDQESDQEPGTVVEQSPDAGSRPQGSQITLSIAVEPPPEKVTIPTDLIGMTQAEAEQALSDVGLESTTQDGQSQDYVAGIVFGVLPPGGNKVDVGDTVNLLISTGPGPEPEEPEDEEPPDPDED